MNMTTTPEDLLIVGASARAAAFSAARAGLRPHWIDQFGDADLSEAFPGQRLAPGEYPDRIPARAAALPAMPFLYTGAMENHRAVIERLARNRELLGNDAGVCAAVRDPERLHAVLRAAGLPAAGVVCGDTLPAAGEWLCKPRNGAGGLGVQFYRHGQDVPAGHYLQAFVAGTHLAAVFLADGRRARLAGVTRQLVGKAALHAARFAYCGSLGPLAPTHDEARQWRRIGDALAGGFGLRGLFGVDAVQSGEGIVTVEVNPRYSASVEVIEAATGMALLDSHVAACRGRLPSLRPASGDRRGKAYLFAPARLRVQGDLRAAPMPCQPDNVKLADVPAAGTVIEAGAPVLSLHARGETEADCLQQLTQSAGAILEKLMT